MDGFRVDTARHVNSEFWQAFIPAIIEHAESEGIPNFYIFGEAAWHDPATLIKTTYQDAYPAVLDFPLFDTVKAVLADKESTHLLASLFAVDSLYKGGTQTARRLPVFNGNHDDGRFAGEALRRAKDKSDEDLARRVKLAYALMFFSRGVPVIYYGDEQGFTGDGRDQASREDMFPSLVASYNDNDLVATDATTAEANFDRDHPLYKAFQEMAALYQAHPALRRGEQVTRLSEREGEGLFAFSRLDEQSGGEYLVVLNTGNRVREAQVTVDARSRDWQSIYGVCSQSVTVTGSYKVRLAPLDFIICRSGYKR
jgi:glycosidase